MAFFRKKTTIKTQNISPIKLPGVTFVDVGTKENERMGGYTIVGGRTPGGSGGGGKIVQSDFGIQEAQKLESQIQEQRQAKERLEEQKRIEAERQAQIEKLRIEKLIQEIKTKGAQEKQNILRNAQNERIRQTITSINKIENGRLTKVNVWKYENLDTGETRYRTYEGSGRNRVTGGVDYSQQTPKDVQKIKFDLNLSGLTPVITNGQVVGFKTNAFASKVYPYTEEGFKKYNNDVSSKGMSFIPGEKKYIPFITEFENLSEALSKSKKGSKIKEAVKFPVRIVSNFVPFVWNNLKNIPPAIAFLATNPKEILNIPKNFYSGVKQDIVLLKTNPSTGIAKVGADYFTFKIVSGTLSITGKVTKAGYIKLNPFLKRVGADGKIVIRKAPAEIFKVRGQERLLKSRVQAPSFKRPFSSVANFLSGRKAGQFRRFTKDPGLVLKSQTVKSGAEALSAQARLAGREVTAVNASAQQLTSWLKRKQIIRKPIPGEANFPAAIKNILNKFDTGKRLKNKEFAIVNLWLQKNVAPHITLLERSLYLDPASGLRISRLGIQEARTASIRDILRGNFKFWDRSKPQILVFENAKIANFPKALNSIKRKLLTGQKLTTAETNKLIRWQVQTGSGKFKPIGSTIYAGGKELEITLAPGEMIRRIKQIGVTYINGKRVTIVSAEVFKPTKAILKQIEFANLGKLTTNQLKKLNNLLSKKLGRKVQVETPELSKSFARKAGRMARRADPNIPVLRLRGFGIVVLRSGMRGLVARPSLRTPIRFSGRVTGKVVNRRTARSTGRVKRNGRITRKTPGGRTIRGRVTRHSRIKKPIRRGRAVRIGRTTPRTTTKKPPIIFELSKKFTSQRLSKQRLSKSVPTYYVVEKVRGKFKKLYPKPLTAKDAKDYAVYSIDNRLSKTAFFVPLGKSKQVVRPPKQIQNYYSRNARKVRPYRIRFGKKKQLVNGFIEKRKFFQDTIGERSQLNKLKRISSARRIVRRKISSSQRRELLLRLKKARAIRMRNLKR